MRRPSVPLASLAGCLAIFIPATARALAAHTEPRALAALEQVLASDPSERVRAEAIRGIADQPASARRTGLLERASRSDPSESNRSLAQQLLTSRTRG